MSIDIYWRRLMWDKQRGVGIAKEGDLRLVLRSPPAISPHAVELDIGEIERGTFAYDPIIRDADYEARRDMTASEGVAFRAYMTHLLEVVVRASRRPPEILEERRK